MKKDDKPLLEQLSQLMDGELPFDQARFLIKRMEHDDGLCSRYERWQLISTCIQRQPIMRLPDDFSARVQSALGDGPARSVGSFGTWFAAVAAAIVVGIALLPTQLGSPQAPESEQNLSARLAELKSEALLMASSASTEFPDVPNRPWPRTQNPVAGVGLTADNIEPYLVRHNEFAHSNGLPSFMPYVDVISSRSDGVVNAGAESAQRAR